MNKRIQISSILTLVILSVLSFACNTDRIVPSTDFQTTALGCGNFTVYRISTDTTRILVVEGSRDSLEIDSTDKTFDLGSETNLRVRLEEYDGAATTVYCDDVAGDDPTNTNTWIAYKGTARIRIIEDNISVFPWGSTYTVQVVLENMEMEDDAGNIKEITNISFNDVLVGWLPG